MTDLESAGVELAVRYLREPGSLGTAVRDVETLYYIAAKFRTEKPAPKQFWEVNAAGTRRLLEVSQEEGVRRFVYCSTGGVYGEIEDQPADEDVPLEPDDHYQASELVGERYAWEYFGRGDMQVTIFRPGSIYRSGDTRFLKLFRAIARGRVVMIGSGAVLYHLVYIDDLVDGILLCGSKPGAPGVVFILAGVKGVTLNPASPGARICPLAGSGGRLCVRLIVNARCHGSGMKRFHGSRPVRRDDATYGVARRQH